MLLFVVLLISSCTNINVDKELDNQIIEGFEYPPEISQNPLKSTLNRTENKGYSKSSIDSNTNIDSDKSLIQNISDPFGETPKGISPNCGPDNRYKFDDEINSKEDFNDFIETYDEQILDRYGNVLIELDDFKVNYAEIIKKDNFYNKLKSAEVDWNKVLEKIKIEKVGSRTVYMLDYKPFMCSGYTLKATNDGHVSVYGCCGI